MRVLNGWGNVYAVRGTVCLKRNFLIQQKMTKEDALECDQTQTCTGVALPDFRGTGHRQINDHNAGGCKYRGIKGQSPLCQRRRVRRTDKDEGRQDMQRYE